MDTREILRILTGTAGAALSGLDQNRENQNTVTRQKMAILMDELARQQQQTNADRAYELDTQQFQLQKFIQNMKPYEAGRQALWEQDQSAREYAYRMAEIAAQGAQYRQTQENAAALGSKTYQQAPPSPSEITNKQNNILAQFAGGRDWSGTTQKPVGNLPAKEELVAFLLQAQPMDTNITNNKWYNAGKSDTLITPNPDYKLRRDYQMLSGDTIPDYPTTTSTTTPEKATPRSMAIDEIIGRVGQERWNKASPAEQEETINAIIGKFK